jgi:methyl-accepting chemotaxis protein
MSLLALMRHFSIRLRMVGAIAVVLALLLMVGATGLWGVNRIQAFNVDLVEHSFEEALALGRLQAGFGILRRHERDMIIQYERADRVAESRQRWEQTATRLRADLEAMTSGEADADDQFARELQSQLDIYVKATLPVAQRLEEGVFDSAATANVLMRDAHAAFDAIDAALEKLELSLADEVAGAYTQAQTTGQQVLWVFLAAVGLAALVVVPTTLANMQSICRPLEQARGLAVSIARGDLTTRADLSGKDEVAELMRCLVDMQDSLTRIVASVRSATDSIGVASQEIASGNQDLSARTEAAASNLEETASSMEQLTSHVRQSAQAAQAASQMAADNASVAQRGGQVVGQVVTTMEDIHQSSQRIADIIGVIDGIAFQTNILALNAAVEAARAGEAGRGFAVVAGEVRSLAQRSAEAARQIKALIGTSVDRVNAGTRLVHEAGRTIGDIVDNAEKVSSFIGEITAASSEQSQGISEVNAAVGQLDQMTQQNAALVEQSAAAAESLREQAQRLAEVVAVFRLGSGEGGHPPLQPGATRSHARTAQPLAYQGPERRDGPR